LGCYKGGTGQDVRLSSLRESAQCIQEQESSGFGNLSKRVIFRLLLLSTNRNYQ
jgi:hypothetical protein